MDNPFNDYYLKQAGSGISVFAGHRYHTGSGFFAKILKHLKPALKYIGRKGLDTMANIGSDVLNGQDLKKAGENQLLNTARDVLTDARTSVEAYKKKRQTGSGRKRRRSRSTSRRPVKRKKTTKKLYKRPTTKRKRKKSVKKNLTFF